MAASNLSECENVSSNSMSQSDEASSINPFVRNFGLIIIVMGLFGNVTAFIIFRFHPIFYRMPCMVFLSFVAVTDTVSLFEWNLGHYLELTRNFDLLKINVPFCRIYQFTQYVSLQSSALILSAMCVDRYVTVSALPSSILYNFPFRTLKTACVWSIGIIFFACSLNFNILLQCGIFFKF